MSVSLKALSQGSSEPPLAKGVLRLYGMRFCPFVHRVRLVLAAKNIPHEVVNIHLKNKPDWYLAKTPDGKVPAIERDGKFVTESLIISDYLDDDYPGPKLWPKDNYERARGRMIIDFATKIHDYLFKVCLNNDMDAMTGLGNALEMFETHFQEKKTKYLAGDSVSMVDYMAWPFFELISTLWGLAKYSGPHFLDGRPQLAAYVQRMENDPVVMKCTVGKQLHMQFMQTSLDKKTDFDVGL